MEINRPNLDSLNIYDKSLNFEKKAETIKEREDKEALKEVCKEFESIFLSMMLKEMKKTIPEGGLIAKSTATEIFEEMYIDELSNEVAKNEDGLGIAKMLYEQFSKGYISI